MTAKTHSYLQDAWTGNPFDSPAARRHSDYSAFDGTELVHLLETKPAGAFAQIAHDAFRAFVTDPAFPCLGGKSAMNRADYRFGAYARLDDAAVTEGLARDLHAFAAERNGFHSNFTTYAAVFREGRDLDEAAFERSMWSQLQQLHDLDAVHHAWDPRVSSDPASPDFSFSMSGTAYFVIGMHPNASRASRRFAYPALIFNAHEQFEQLRALGSLDALTAKIRTRDIALDGTINGNLDAFGTTSEAKQYSGRLTGDAWKCPFHPRT